MSYSEDERSKLFGEASEQIDDLQNIVNEMDSAIGHGDGESLLEYARLLKESAIAILDVAIGIKEAVAYPEGDE